ncbi:MAG: response regulator, partial [Acetobacteraceae bacterium]
GVPMNYVAERVRAARRPPPETPELVSRRTPLVLVIEDRPAVSAAIAELCAYLGVSVDRLGSERDLLRGFRERRPMAVIATLDGPAQDGCYVMMQLAEHDPTVPLLLLTGGNEILSGAADAVAELCALTALTQASGLPDAAELVAFLFRAGQAGRCLGLLPPS